MTASDTSIKSLFSAGAVNICMSIVDNFSISVDDDLGAISERFPKHLMATFCISLLFTCSA